MPDLVDSATAILSQAQHRAEIAGQNIANSTTPAYKRRILFTELLQTASGTVETTAKLSASIDLTAGKLVQTGNPFDLAISGEGYFAVQQGEAVRYVRAGRFDRNAAGQLVDVLGGALQKADGTDLIVTDGNIAVRSNGDIVQNGVGSGRIAVFASADGTLLPPVTGGYSEPLSGLVQSDEARIVQGAYEASNVATGDEMVAMTQAIRQAESGQRVMIVYDDIMGRVISTFGESVR